MIRLLQRLSLIIVCIAPLIFAGESSRADSTDQPAIAVIRGRAVCLDDAGRIVDSLFYCKTSRFGFVDKDSKLYRFSEADTQAAIFTDARVRQRELQITAQLHGVNQLEIIKVQSVRDGKLYDIYYFCELCNIRAYAPGLCPCCRNELQFRESPSD